MKKLLTLLLFTSCLSTLAQQDPQYNLYQFNQMIINPAYAGGRDGLAAIAAMRQQWAGFSGAPQTMCFSLHTPLLKKNIGVGLTVINDRMGPRNVSSFYGNFAYILKINRKVKLSFGLNAGYNQYRFNFNEISFKADESTPVQFLARQNLGALDINSGMYLKTSDFFVGISASHLNAPDIYSYVPQQGTGKYVYKLKTHLFITAGKSFILNRDFVFAPTVLIKTVNDTYGADFNLNFFLYKKMWLGVFYRNGYGPGGLIQYYINNKTRIAYSYDSGIGSASKLGGSHELMIGFDFFNSTNKGRMVNPRFL